MGRKARLYCESQVYHVIMRGNNKQNLFYEDSDRYLFIRRLKKYTEELQIDVYSYCLMSNHVHILIGKANKNMSKLIQRLATSYAMYFNRKYERSGHLFQGRYKSEPVDSDEYFKTVTRYIIQNPLKANLEDFINYRWNGLQHLIRESKNCLIEKNRLYEVFEGKENFFRFIMEKQTGKCMEYENKFVLNDNQCVKYIKKLLGINSTYNLISMTPETQKTKLSILKEKGIPVNQISRITGIALGIIKRA